MPIRPEILRATVLGGPPPIPTTPPTILNPGFETAFAGEWVHTIDSGGSSRYTGIQHTGSWSWSMIQGAAGTEKLEQTISGLTSVNWGPLTVHCWARRIVGSPHTLKIYDVTHSNYICTMTMTNAGSFVETTKLFTIPTGTLSIRIELIPSAAEGDHMFWDDLSFTYP